MKKSSVITTTGKKLVTVPLMPILWVRRTPDGKMFASIALQRLLTAHLNMN